MVEQSEKKYYGKLIKKCMMEKSRLKDHKEKLRYKEEEERRESETIRRLKLCGKNMLQKKYQDRKEEEVKEMRQFKEDHREKKHDEEKETGRQFGSDYSAGKQTAE